MAQDQKPSNTMGDVINNKGIVTQGQVGNNTIYNTPPRSPNGLYQADQIVGSVGSAKMGPNANQITVENLRISSGTVDLTAPLEFQDYLIRCHEFQRMPMGAMGAATISIAIGGTIVCEIVGKRG